MNFEEQLKIGFDKIVRNEPVDNFRQGNTIGKACGVKWTLDSYSRAITFDRDCIRCVQQSSEDVLGHGHEHQIQGLISGAGHDSVRVFCTLAISIVHSFIIHWLLIRRTRFTQAREYQRR